MYDYQYLGTIYGKLHKLILTTFAFLLSQRRTDSILSNKQLERPMEIYPSILVGLFRIDDVLNEVTVVIH